jgi:hypothetical protein
MWTRARFIRTIAISGWSSPLAARTIVIAFSSAAAASSYLPCSRNVVPELRDSSFGARIEVTNNVPIAVERSLYWNALGALWAGGTNALATPLP